MQFLNPQQAYESQLASLHARLKKHQKQKNRLAWFRFLSLIAAVVATWQLWNVGWFIAIPAGILLVALFLFFVTRDIDNREGMENVERLIEINKEEIGILQHQFTGRPGGSEWKPSHHHYAEDLDLFGNASLYQYLNRAQSQQGTQLFAQWLLEPAAAKTITDRQDAGKELGQRIFDLQQFRSFSRANPLSFTMEKNVKAWLEQENKFSRNTAWLILRFVFPVIALAVLAFFIFDIIPSSIFYPLLALFFIIAFGITKSIMPQYMLLNKIVPELETLSQTLAWMEKLEAEAFLLKNLKQKIETGSQRASVSIRDLKKILERLDYRFNPLVYVPLNLFLLWDLQQAIALENWRSGRKQNVEQWFSAIAEMEGLITLATIGFNHPDWCMPKINGEAGFFKATNLGHPLIPPEKRITNSFRAGGSEKLSLVTGSNMAGKSTFLRSVGTNMVLAMAGAPVCATELELAEMKVMSSMRISDNLEENTSTFYAELKKLKEIIEAVKRHEKVYLLLDEILRGTNSNDRHTGSAAFIKQLIKENASALVATHDLELTKLADEFPGRMHNYHFDVQVKGEELYFDYVLKEGICRSMNASLLMRKIGIEL